LSIASSHHRSPTALFERELLTLVSIPTLEQTCDDLLVRARPMFIRSRLSQASSLSPRCVEPKGTTELKIANSDISRQARAAAKVY
jgi:hypothetical protein